MSPDEMRALIAEARAKKGLRPIDEPAQYIEGLIDHLADALEAALFPLPDEQLDAIEKRLAEFDAEGYCRCYHESQERECHQHGDQASRRHGDVADDLRDLLAEVRRLRVEESTPDVSETPAIEERTS